MCEKKLCYHTALYCTFTISKVNLNLQYFCLIEIWKSEVQGWNLSKIFGILTSGFGHNKITSNEPWNTETHKTDRNPPITNHKQWPFEPVEINFHFPRSLQRWLASEIFWREDQSAPITGTAEQGKKWEGWPLKIIFSNKRPTYTVGSDSMQEKTRLEFKYRKYYTEVIRNISNYGRSLFK